MSFKISWYIPERVILLHLEGELELSEIEKMLSTVKDMMTDGIAPVHVLLDDSKGGHPPTSLSQLKGLMPLGDLDMLGWVVAIGDVNPIAQFLVPMLMKILKINFVRYPTLEAAVEFLKKQDVSVTASLAA